MPGSSTSPNDFTNDVPFTTASITGLFGHSQDGTTSQSTNITTSVYDTYDYFIHPHWKQFPLVADHWHYVVGIYITFVGITGICGNSLVIWIFSTTKNLKTPSNMLVMNLALSDLVFSAVNGFPLLTISAFNKRWMWGDAACQLYGFIGGLFGLMSIITLAAISIDRYYNIAEPLKAAQYMTRRKAFMMIVVVWIWSLVWAIPPLFGWGAYVPEGFQTSCTFDYVSREPHMRTYIIALYVGGFFIPMIIIIYCYILIWRAIRKHDREMLKMAKKMKVEDIRANQEKTKAEVRIAKIAMVIVCLYLLSWSPYATVALIAQFGPSEMASPYVAEVCVLLAKAAAMHNPIVYAFSHPRFRDALNRRVPWLMCCCDVKPTRTPSASHNQTTKRGVNRTVSNDSYYGGGNDSDVSSCVSHVDDYGQSIEMRKTISETSFNRNPSERMDRIARGADAEGDSGGIVRELIHALVSVTNRQQHAPQQSASNNLGNGVFVVDNGKQVEISTFLAKLVASGEKDLPCQKQEKCKNVQEIVDETKTTTTNSLGDVKAVNGTIKDENKHQEITTTTVGCENAAYTNDDAEDEGLPEEECDGQV